jgi:amiloride-sensitive sodium channel
MSFISVIEIFYFVFLRRMFLWQRVKWTRFSKRMTRILSRKPEEGKKSRSNPVSFDAVQNDNLWLSSATLNSTILTISSSTLDHPVALTRRHSLNLPPHLQKQLSKY